MMEIIAIIPAILLAIVTVYLFELFRFVSNHRLRMIIPLICGIVLALLFFTPMMGLIVNPYASRIPFIEFFYLTLPLIFPLLIVPILTCIEKRTGSRFGKTAVFTGAFAAIVLFYVIRQSGLISYDDMQMIEFFSWTGGILLISTIVFLGIHAFLKAFFGSPADHVDNPDSEKPQTVHVVTKVPIISLAGGLLVVGVLFIPLSLMFTTTFYMPFHSDNRGGANLLINLVNESIARDGTIIVLTEEKMQKFPALASIINRSVLKNTREEMVLFSCREELAMKKEELISTGGSSSPVYIEYQGKFYTAEILHHAGTYC